MAFDCDLNFKNIDCRKQPELYQVDKGEQGVLMVEPYICPVGASKIWKSQRNRRKKSINCFCITKNKMISSEWIWPVNFCKWGAQGHAVMPITRVAGSTMRTET